MLVVFDSIRFSSSSSLIGANGINNTKENPTLVIKFAKDIEYFDSIYENVNNFSIINAKRYVFYRDLYVFVDCLKNLARKFVKEQRIRELVSSCLRSESLI